MCIEVPYPKTLEVSKRHHPKGKSAPLLVIPCITGVGESTMDKPTTGVATDNNHTYFLVKAPMKTRHLTPCPPMERTQSVGTITRGVRTETLLQLGNRPLVGVHGMVSEHGRAQRHVQEMQLRDAHQHPLLVAPNFPTLPRW